MTPWLTRSRSTWIEKVSAWVANALLRAGEALPADPVIVRERPWSLVLRFDSGARPFYFKASPACGAHEPALLSHLAAKEPDLVPHPLAIDASRGWALLPDVGTPLADVADGLPVWRRLLPRYARLQRASCDDQSLLLGLRVPDRRLQRLPTLVHELLENERALRRPPPDGLTETEHHELLRTLPFLEADCSTLRALGIPDGLDHGDLHDINVMMDDGCARLIDWGDSCVTHPFCSIFVALHSLFDGDLACPAALELRDIYLREWTHVAQLPELTRAFAASTRIATALRALDWACMLSDAPDADTTAFQPSIARWLRVWHARSRADAG